MLLLNLGIWLYGAIELLDEVLEFIGYDIIPWINLLPDN